MKKAGVVCCSNGQLPMWKNQNARFGEALRQLELEPVFSPCLYAELDCDYAGGAQRAEILMQQYRDPDIRVIYDISGGELSNGVLEYLDYAAIAASGTELWGYSDVSAVLNAIWTKTGNSGVLYQPKNIVLDKTGEQLRRFAALQQGDDELFRFPFRFLRGNAMEGTLIGGNIRCFLKLAGTPYFPDVTGKLLLLESYGGEVPQITSLLCQLRQIGVFERISGLILGTFTTLEKNASADVLEELVLRHVPERVPVVRTEEIGHANTSRAARIGGNYRLSGTVMEIRQKR